MLLLLSHFSCVSKPRFSQRTQVTSCPSRRLFFVMCVCMRAKSLQSCLTLCNPMDCSPPGSSVHGISQARILEWVVTPSSGDLPDSGIELVSLSSPALADGFFTTNTTWEAFTLSQNSLLVLRRPPIGCLFIRGKSLPPTTAAEWVP